MSVERAFLVAAIDSILIAEPTVESRPILDTEIRDVAQLLVDAYVGLPGHDQSVEDAQAVVDALLGGAYGEPRRDAWLGVWEGYGRPDSVILCTTWRGMPFIAHVLTAPAARGRGYASSLVREAAGLFKKSGATHVGVTLDRESPFADLFRELGFVEMFSSVDA